MPAVNPDLLHIPRAAFSSDAAVEVVGTLPAVLRMNVPAVGVPQAFAVPLVPPEALDTVVMPDKAVKVA